MKAAAAHTAIDTYRHCSMIGPIGLAIGNVFRSKLLLRDITEMKGTIRTAQTPAPR